MKHKLTVLSVIAALTVFGVACEGEADVDADVPEVDAPEVDVPEVPEGPDIEGGAEGEADG